MECRNSVRPHHCGLSGDRGLTWEYQFRIRILLVWAQGPRNAVLPYADSSGNLINHSVLSGSIGSDSPVLEQENGTAFTPSPFQWRRSHSVHTPDVDSDEGRLI